MKRKNYQLNKKWNRTGVEKEHKNKRKIVKENKKNWLQILEEKIEIFFKINRDKRKKKHRYTSNNKFWNSKEEIKKHQHNVMHKSNNKETK